MKAAKNTLASALIVIALMVSMMLPQPAKAAEPVCQIGTTTYTDFEAALNALGADYGWIWGYGTIKLLTDINYSKGILIGGGQVTFDLNGHRLNVNTDEDHALHVIWGTVNIEGAGEFNVTSSGGSGVFVEGAGHVTLTSATSTADGEYGAYADGEDDSASITLTGDARGSRYGAYAYSAEITVGGNAQGDVNGAGADGAGGRIEVYGDAIGTGYYGASAAFGGEVIVYGNAQGAYIAAYAERDSRVEVAGDAISTSEISNSAGAYAQEGGVVKVGGKAQGRMGAWANNGQVEVAGDAISTGGDHGAYAQEGGVVKVGGNAQGNAYAETGGRIEVAGDAIGGAYAVSGSVVTVGGNAQGGDNGAWSSGAGSRVEVMCDVTGSFASVYAAQEAAVHVHGNARLISDSGATTYGVYINNSGGSTPCTVTIDGDLTASAPAAIGIYSVFGGVTTIKGGFSAPAGTAIWLSDAYITAGAAVTVDGKAYLRYSNAGNRVDARVITISATLLYIDRTFNKFVDPPPDVTTTITWNSAHSVTDVMERGISIGPGNYSVTNINGTTATLAIKNAWLMAQPVGIHVLTIEFDEGRRATLTISIIDTRYVASAAIIPAYGTFNRNLTARADVNANITWNAASSVKNVKVGGTSIGAAYYSVSGNTLTIKKEYLVKKPVGQLALTVEFDKGYPAALSINILPENAAIKPSSGTFDKNSPADVATVITWHDASSVTAVKAGGASIGSGFSVSGNTLTIKKEYLTTKPLGSLALTVEFDKGGPAALTITISKSAEISPTAGTFDKTYPADVTTAITWNNASTVTDVKAGGTSIGSGNYSVVGNTLTIKKEYLTTKPLGPLALTVEFDKGGPAELTIAFSQSAAISPASGEYDRNPGAGKDVTTTITWNDARSVTDVTLGETSIGAGSYTMDGTKLTISKDYLASRPVGNLVLSVKFNQGRPAALTIAIIPANAVISPASGAFDKTYPADVDTAITWYDAGSVTGVKAGGTSLGAGSYGVVENTLTINKDYLATQAVGPLALTVEFDKGLPAALTITISKSAEISPTVGTFDKTYPVDVTTAITLNNASTVTDVKAGGTSIGSGFSVSGNMLTIKKEYLTTKPLSPLALTVEFDKGSPAELTIAFSKSAAINPASGTFDRNAAAQEDVTTNITWNDASSVTDVKLNGTSVEADDYTVRGDTLTINKNCLARRPYGDLVATVEFDKGAPATLAIAVTPENAVLYAITGTFDLIHQSNATASIGWNDAGSVTDVKAADGETSIGSGNYSLVGNTLTIKKEYLATLSVGEVVLTVEFERGASATMTITVIDSPSISPASGTFDRDPDHQADVTTTIYWSYAKSVIDVLVLKMMDGVPTWVTLEPVH